MPIENSKAHEIKKITTPLSFKNSKAYDSDGNLVKCVETLADVKFIVEPREGILTDNEIMQYAPQSKAASKIRLKRGFGDSSDVLLVHESLPWVLGLYYVILICISLPILFSKVLLGMIAVLILFIVPLAYLYFTFNMNRYIEREDKKQVETTRDTSAAAVQGSAPQNDGVESLKKYEKEVNNLKVLFDVKEEVVRDLIKKRFEPPQITYDKFISMIDSCHKLFYEQADSTLSIVKLAVEDTPRIEDEIQNKIGIMKSIINQIEELTNELVININSDEESEEEVKNLIDDMENLIGSVKEY